ncbi:AMP-binding protein, partial [Micromonospora sp. DT68]
FDADRINRLLDHCITALANGLAQPDEPAEEIDILTGSERDHILYSLNPVLSQDPDGLAPWGLLHGVLAGHEASRVAIRFQGVDLSYGELDRRSTRLAQKLRSYGIGPGDIVGLLLDRGLHLPVAQLAVMKAGAAWTMLDPQLPPARLAYQTSDSGA